LCVCFLICVFVMFMAAWHSVLMYNLRLTTWKERKLFSSIIK
jgi:hypothetical protein